MEAPEGFRNSDEDCFSESQVNRILLKLRCHCGCFYVNICLILKESSVADAQDLGQVEIPNDKDERRSESGDGPPGETRVSKQR